MTVMRWTTLATMAWALWQMPGLAQAEVYRCSVGGRTVYQDLPCADATEAVPHKASGAPGAARSAPPDRGTLHRQLLDAREQSERLRTLYERDVQQAKANAATMSLDQQRQLTKVLHARWDPKLQAAGRREQELTDALRKICRGGTTLNAQTQQCSK